MVEHESRSGGVGEGGSGLLANQEHAEGDRAGPASIHSDDSTTSASSSFDLLPPPAGDPVDLNALEDFEGDIGDELATADGTSEVNDLADADAYDDVAAVDNAYDEADVCTYDDTSDYGDSGDGGYDGGDSDGGDGGDGE
jgi:hypothetical protein